MSMTHCLPRTTSMQSIPLRGSKMERIPTAAHSNLPVHQQTRTGHSNASVHASSHQDRNNNAGIIRKNNKPLMEKKRRQRINRSLDELKKLITDPQRKDSYSKLEKADILDMAVKYIRTQIQSRTEADSQLALSCFLSGYASCEHSTLTYVTTQSPTSPASNSMAIMPQLRGHLQRDREATALRFLHAHCAFTTSGGKQLSSQGSPTANTTTTTTALPPLEASINHHQAFLLQQQQQQLFLSLDSYNNNNNLLKHHHHHHHHQSMPLPLATVTNTQLSLQQHNNSLLLSPPIIGRSLANCSPINVVDHSLSSSSSSSISSQSFSTDSVWRPW